MGCHHSKQAPVEVEQVEDPNLDYAQLSLEHAIPPPTPEIERTFVKQFEYTWFQDKATRQDFIGAASQTVFSLETSG